MISRQIEDQLALEQSFVGDDLVLPLSENQDKKESKGFEILRSQIASCQQCTLCETRTQTVFGVGSPTADLMFVGEAPGKDEDLQGIPFVGRSGQLLTKMIEAMGSNRDDVFIVNILKCRPPENRNPSPFQIEKCSPYLKQQIAMVKPKVICTLGNFATKTLLQTETSIAKIRGQKFKYEGVILIPTYHPAYLLRRDTMKKYVWEDLKLVMSLL
jgi:DNA polymerase